MAFQLSPGVNVSEIDLTTIVPAVGTTEGAIVGSFNWGPVDEIRTISNELELVDLYGEPDSNTFVDFFSAANFLSYARNLKVVRANASGVLNATSNNNGGIAGRYIKNVIDYTENHRGSNVNGSFAAKWAGDLGNALRIEICANTTAFTSWPYKSQFQSAPNTSSYVALAGGSKDEMHIAVLDNTGVITGTANTILEKFAFVSKAGDARRDDGSSNYYADVLNQQSKYIWWLSHPDAANNSNWGKNAANTVFQQPTTIALPFSGGVYNVSTDGQISSGYDKFKNPDEVDISLIITSGHSANVAKYVVDNVAEYRKDSIVFISPPKANVVNQSDSTATANAIIAYRDTITSTSYAVMDSGWKYQFDKYSNTYRWVPLNGDIAGLCVRTDFERDPWFSPAGFNRGLIKNVTRLAWSPNKTNRDELYKNGINPVVSFPGEGTILFGDKTLLSRPSAFDRINVRRLFIVLEKAIARAAKFSLFEFNDAFTRAQFVSLVEPYLRDVQGRRGIYDFRVVCDETNNTPEVIDRNEFVGDIYIKPARSINYIQLNFVAVRTGVSFDEIVGRF